MNEARGWVGTQCHRAWTVQCYFFMNGHCRRLRWLAAIGVKTDKCFDHSPPFLFLENTHLEVSGCLCDLFRRSMNQNKWFWMTRLPETGLVTCWAVVYVFRPFKVVTACPAVVLHFISHSLWLKLWSHQLEEPVCVCGHKATITSTTMWASASSSAYGHTCVHTLLGLFLSWQHNDSHSLSFTKDDSSLGLLPQSCPMGHPSSMTWLWVMISWGVIESERKRGRKSAREREQWKRTRSGDKELSRPSARIYERLSEQCFRCERDSGLIGGKMHCRYLDEAD